MFPIPATIALIDERVTDEARLVDAAESRDDVGRNRLRREQVGPESAGSTVPEREHRAVPLRRLPFAPAEDEPRRAAPARVRVSTNTPATVHA